MLEKKSNLREKYQILEKKSNFKVKNQILESEIKFYINKIHFCNKKQILV